MRRGEGGAGLLLQAEAGAVFEVCKKFKPHRATRSHAKPREVRRPSMRLLDAFAGLGDAGPRFCFRVHARLRLFVSPKESRPPGMAWGHRIRTKVLSESVLCRARRGGRLSRTSRLFCRSLWTTSRCSLVVITDRPLFFLFTVGAHFCCEQVEPSSFPKHVVSKLHPTPCPTLLFRAPTHPRPPHPRHATPLPRLRASACTARQSCTGPSERWTSP